MHRILGKPGARTALVLLRVTPMRFDCGSVAVQAGLGSEIERELARTPAAKQHQQHRVHQRPGYRASLFRQGNGHTQLGADRLSLAKDYLQYGAVDAVLCSTRHQ